MHEEYIIALLRTMELKLVRKINNGWELRSRDNKGGKLGTLSTVFFLEHAFLLEKHNRSFKRKGAENQNKNKTIFCLAFDTTIINMYSYFL